MQLSHGKTQPFLKKNKNIQNKNIILKIHLNLRFIEFIIINIDYEIKIYYFFLLKLL